MKAIAIRSLRGRNRRANKYQRRAAAMVEFALILPVLLTIALGCVDSGRFAYYHIAVTHAAEVGAQFAAFHPFTPTTQSNWNAKTLEAVINEMQGVAGYNPQKLVVPNPVVITETSNSNLRRVQVEVRYTFNTLVPWTGVPSTIVLTRRVEMRVVR
jgi:Flp pilus assembly protein TadG